MIDSIQYALFLRHDLAERLDVADDPLIVLLDLAVELGWMQRSRELYPNREAIAQEVTRLVGEIELLLAHIRSAVRALQSDDAS